MGTDALLESITLCFLYFDLVLSPPGPQELTVSRSWWPPASLKPPVCHTAWVEMAG